MIEIELNKEAQLLEKSFGGMQHSWNGKDIEVWSQNHHVLLLIVNMVQKKHIESKKTQINCQRLEKLADGSLAGSVTGTELHFDSDASEVEVGHSHGRVLLKIS